jgi:hypothetical protein
MCGTQCTGERIAGQAKGEWKELCWNSLDGAGGHGHDHGMQLKEIGIAT